MALPFYHRAPKPHLQHDLKLVLPDFETVAQAKFRHRRLVSTLTSGDSAARKLGQMLAQCTNEAPCGANICPKCVRRLRRWFTGVAMPEIERWLREPASDDDGPLISSFSLVPIEHRRPEGDLDELDLTQAIRKFKKQLQRTDFNGLLLGGLDVSLNEDSERQFEPHWQLQFYLVAVGTGCSALRTDLDAHFEADKLTPRPIRVRACTDLPRCLSYVVKPFFVRRIGYTDDRNRRQTRKLPLRSRQLREVCEWLDRYSMTDRLVLTGLRRQGVKLIPTSSGSCRGLSSRRRS